MYHFQQELGVVKGLGDKLTSVLAKKNYQTVLDLLLALPIRYEDRSKLCLIKDWQEGELLTTIAELKSISSYYKNRLLITRANIIDESGKASCFWFNNKFIKQNLKVGQQYYFSGKVGQNNTLMQAAVEALKAETLHTNRLVPIYSSSLTDTKLKQGQLRRILKEIIDHLEASQAELNPELKNQALLKLSTQELFHYLHFPDQAEQVVTARERLAVEELVSLIKHSWQLKEQWQSQHTPFSLQIQQPFFPDSIPFTLTQAQQQASQEILTDLSQTYPMNRILIGDVGAGKTVVAGIAAHHCLANQQSVCLIAPTQILAQQHHQTFQKIFPQLKLDLVTATQKKAAFKPSSTPTLYIGTHALFNKLTKIQPALIIYDEQHRFGVKQRSLAKDLTYQPHILTMTATPIPRSLMLTIFSHLQISYLNQLPPGRKKPTTWLVPQPKRDQAYTWIFEQLSQQADSLAIIICPFIDPSSSQALENVQAVKAVYEEIAQKLAEFSSQPAKATIKLGLLHSKLKKTEQAELIQDLFKHQINLLVATPIVEVGIDLPTANIIAIESAQRFGLASLHQLRGRVGRAGQESFCLLFDTSPTANSRQRLKTFCHETDGLKLAEADLQNRGAGDIFGTSQHGFNQLRFASWTNVQLIKQANDIAFALQKNQQQQLSALADFFHFETKNEDLLAN